MENDLILTQFLDKHESTLSDEEVDAFTRLIELSDNELMDVLLGRLEPSGDADLLRVHALVTRIRAM